MQKPLLFRFVFCQQNCCPEIEHLHLKKSSHCSRNTKKTDFSELSFPTKTGSSLLGWLATSGYRIRVPGSCLVLKLSSNFYLHIPSEWNKWWLISVNFTNSQLIKKRKNLERKNMTKTARINLFSFQNQECINCSCSFHNLPSHKMLPSLKQLFFSWLSDYSNFYVWDKKNSDSVKAT